ncbi:alanine/glycine:cation symporter family protein [Endozoicomonas montiporae]|uniref:Alanine or glycine:cation symporter, AGCS family n=1 Tax=Endozoicomonas montiporae CL-33 TaxID=570277 RepID=A0A142BHS4_9GAMM|nr:alanine/glycine:cation symporter family protein [Endozoicomonas montiporae]AMO58300.1 alanine or glycine:cation symporter, AGCS family [Endozoicomonas montiporae CL-33]
MSGMIDAIASVLWGYLLIYLLLGAGIYFTLRSRFVQFRHFLHAWKIMFASRRTGKNEISSFQALCTGLAAHVGTGNLAGVAIAIYIGGPGAIFWMWVVALLGMSSSYIENTLAQLYKTNNNDGTFRGGPAYYIQKALGLRWLGVLFSSLLLIAFGFVFNMVHANSVAASVSAYSDISIEFVGLSMALITSLIIFRGIHTITRFAEMVVPFMALAYFLIAMIVVVMHLEDIPAVFSLIISHAFGVEQAVGGGIGYSVAQAIMQGVKRGLFSNEAGMGSGPNAAATATPWPHHPAAQGIISMTSVFIDTIVICTATAAIVILSGQLESGNTLNGIQLTQASLGSIVGPWGEWFITGAVILFGFTSVVANYYYGESNLLFMKNNRYLLLSYRLVVVALVYLGAVSSLEAVWVLADLAMGLMALINLVVIVLLSGPALQVLKDYDRQLQAGKSPVFNRKKFPFLHQTMDSDVWVSDSDDPDDFEDGGLNTSSENSSSEAAKNLGHLPDRL